MTVERNARARERSGSVKGTHAIANWRVVD